MIKSNLRNSFGSLEVFCNKLNKSEQNKHNFFSWIYKCLHTKFYSMLLHTECKPAPKFTIVIVFPGFFTENSVKSGI